MPHSKRKQARRRQLARVRAAFTHQPLAMDTRAAAQLLSAAGTGDLDMVAATLSMGSSDAPPAYRIENGVAIIPVTGVLRDEADWMVSYYGCGCYQNIERDFQAAIANSQVKAVAFYINSPGGSAVGCKRLADRIFAARGAKPIIAYTQGMAASAAYYIASACDRIVATADALVGSIGTIYTHAEISGMAKQFGYGFTVLTNADSPKKGHGNMYEPLGEEARKTLQAFVDSYGAPFVADVARNRGVTAEKVKADFGQGDVLISSKALNQGLCDQIVSGWDQFLSNLAAGMAIQSSSQTNDEPEDEDDEDLIDEEDNDEELDEEEDQDEDLDEEDEDDETTYLRSENDREDPEEDEDEEEPTDEEDDEDLEDEDDDEQPSDEDEDDPSEADEDEEQPTNQRNERKPIANRPPLSRSLTVKKIKAQLFAMGLLASADASDKAASAAVRKYCKSLGIRVPKTEAAILAVLQGKRPKNNVQRAHDREQAEAREAAKASLSELKAAAELLNKGGAGITADMVMEAFEQGLDCKAAIKAWNKKTSAEAPALAGNRISHVGSGSDNFSRDAIEAIAYRATNGASNRNLSAAASNLVNHPLWAIAGQCLQLAGERVDMYGDREAIAERAMEMGGIRRRHFFSTREGRQYISADAGVPASRPGDFPNILSSLANKFLDSIELDDDYSFEKYTAVLPGGLKDFRPGGLMNKGIAEELDVIEDAQALKELGLSEEMLSYIFLQRFGNKWGWTPVMIANDDLGAFAEGMLGLDEAWMVTQNRLCLDLLTGNPTLLDGSALFRTANDRTSGGTPSDAEWAAMETLYADITGVGTTRRVRGTLNAILVPTGTAKQEAVRTFAPINSLGEPKVAATTSNVGIYRGDVEIISDGELRGQSVTTRFYGFRSPRNLRTATIVRGYFQGYGTGGRREQWYDPATKTTWVSIEGRVGAAIKNWRYAVRNKGAA